MGGRGKAKGRGGKATKAIAPAPAGDEPVAEGETAIATKAPKVAKPKASGVKKLVLDAIQVNGIEAAKTSAKESIQASEAAFREAEAQEKALNAQVEEALK